MTRTSNQIENMVRESNHIWDDFITKYLLYTTDKTYLTAESGITIDETYVEDGNVVVNFTYNYADSLGELAGKYYTTLPVESIVGWIEHNKEGIERYNLLSELCPLKGNDTVTVQLNCGWFIQAVKSGNEVAYNFYNSDGDHQAEVVIETKTIVITNKVDYLYD